jgi:hypothetical protein
MSSITKKMRGIQSCAWGCKPEPAARSGMNFRVRGRRHGILTLKAVGVDERFSVDKRLPVDGRCI